MLTGIGRPAAPGDAVDLLLECHTRIRAFLSLAARLAAARDAPPEEIRDAAAQVRRYFEEALPLHARDEEDSLLPRLRGLDPAVDAELATMHREHGEHEPPLRALLDACARLAADPAQHAALSGQVGAAAAELERHFAAHLRREEEVIFPAVRRHLDARATAEIVREIRSRRGVAPAAPSSGSAGARSLPSGRSGAGD